MSQTVSPSVGRPYGLARVCHVWQVPRSSVYAAKQRRSRPLPLPAKRGPKTALSDAELTDHIRHAIEQSAFLGEGYRKVWALLRLSGIRTSRPRVLRLMRAAQLLAPNRARRTAQPTSHSGHIITALPNHMWGTDATSAWTPEGVGAIFFAIDHCTGECVGIHAARRGTRFEALEPIRQGVREQFGSYNQAIATGLRLRHDHGSQFRSDAFQEELRFLGISSSPAFVREPETNGVAERFVKTLKEQLLWVQHFDTVEQLRLALLAFRDRYNHGWLVARHGYRTPAAVRADLLSRAA
jgi:putative transposase